ncbi:MAG: polysaccharide biosynthesis protein [Nocardioides sp.]|nr:polysaccharide biosynthesis protein [Nocardioides sp.]
MPQQSSSPAGETGGGPAAGSTGGAVRTGGTIAVAIVGMNVATYGFTILAARLLGPSQYGAFAAVMNLLMVVSVAQLALQATAARRVSSTPGDVTVIEERVRSMTRRLAVGLGLVLLVLSPVVNAVLRLDSLVTAALVAATAVPLTVMGGQAGVLQGERRWRPLALLYLAAGVPRLLLGGALLVWRPEEGVATLGVLIGALFPVAVGAWALRRPRTHATDATGTDHGVRSLLRESFRNSHALLAFFAVTNVDIIVARGVLDDHDSGLYAGGLILTKAMLFLPQFVVVLAFPDMADARERRRALRLSLGAVAGLGAVGVLAAWVLSPVAMVFVGGPDYAEIEGRLWVFAVLGTALSMIQLLVYGLLAQEGRRRATVLLWAALAVIALGGQATDSVTGLLTLVTATDVVLFLALLVPVVLAAPEPAPSPEPTDAD